MRRIGYFFRLFTILLVIVNTGFTAADGSAVLRGRVTGAQNGDALSFANVVIKGTTIGISTDIDGFYILTNVPEGEVEVEASYLGYIPVIKKITLKAGEKKDLNFALEFDAIQGETVVVTAQAEGQMNAISQQLNSNSIVNVVSSSKIRELPDANAAESIGRLPGVSVLRNGGEGTKVVIRGLSPQYNTININGVRMAASGSGDRSSDLSMISPYMLEGIEVSKAVTADQDADVLGGSVNFKIKKAPEKFKVDALLQGGYNGIAETFYNYKIMTGLSNRFWDNSLGIFGQIDIEQRNRSSQEFGANYAMDDLILRDVYFTTLDLEDVSREKNRYGATLVFDYDLSRGNIVFSNFGSKIDNAVIKHGEKHNANNNVHTYSSSEMESNLGIMINSLEFNYGIGSLKINALVANSYTENEIPYQLLNSFDEGSAYESIDPYGDPKDAPKTAKLNLDRTYMQRIQMITSWNKENETTGALNFIYDLPFSDAVGSKIKFGVKYRHKKREYDKNEQFLPMNWGGRQEERDKLLDAFPWMQDYFGYGSLNVPVGPFIDRNYSPNNFLNGAYDITNGLNVGLLADAYNVLKSDMWTHHPNTIKDDYSGHEDYMAGYLSMELNFGSELTVIPGIRFESNQTTYTANRGNETIFLAQEKYQYKDTTTARENNFWLPNLHVKYRPVDWINIKFAYTQTLTRPSYAQIIPKWNIGSTNVTMGNPYLKAATSENFDLNISVYENYVGLLAVGGFLKRIENLIFYTGKRAITDPAELGLPSNTLGMTYTTFINNNYNVDVWGLETEWQTHFWYLPGILKGFVFNINYTHIFSEAKYPQTTIQSIFNPNGPPYFVSTNIDTFYTNRLINQPDDIINASLGYDYKGFSARISLLFQSNIFKKNNPQPELKGYTEDYLRWDLVINQKLPLKGMMLYFNFNNITGSFDRAIVAGPQFPTSEQHYGYTVDLGLRYNF